MNVIKHWSIFLFLLLVASCGGGKKPEPGVDITPFSDRAALGNVSPSFGTGGERVTIKGEGFYPLPLQVFFDTEEAVVLVASEEEILLVAPAPSTREPHSASIRIMNADGEEVVFENAFEYKDFGGVITTLCPKITSVQPNIGLNNSPVVINGENFVVGDVPDDGQTIVSVGGKISVISGEFSSSQISISIPNLDNSCSESKCPVKVAIVNPDGCKAVLEDGFDYIQPDYDNDGLTYYEEVNEHKTDPDIADTDGDGIDDGLEVRRDKTDPTNPEDVDLDQDKYSALVDEDCEYCNDCDDHNFFRNPGVVGDTFDNDKDTDCKPDVIDCKASVTSGAGPYNARITLDPDSFELYSVNAWGFLLENICHGRVEDLTENYQCSSWPNLGWKVVKTSEVGFELHARSVNFGGQQTNASCKVGD